MPSIATVNIPGEFYAYYEDGKIEALTFCPWAPDAEVVDGDESLDVEEDGPFWTALRDALSAPQFVVEDNKLTPGTGVPIEWVE